MIIHNTHKLKCISTDHTEEAVAETKGTKARMASLREV